MVPNNKQFGTPEMIGLFVAMLLIIFSLIFVGSLAVGLGLHLAGGH